MAPKAGLLSIGSLRQIAVKFALKDSNFHTRTWIWKRRLHIFVLAIKHNTTQSAASGNVLIVYNADKSSQREI